jgi:hypothetical protein
LFTLHPNSPRNAPRPGRVARFAHWYCSDRDWICLPRSGAGPGIARRLGLGATSSRLFSLRGSRNNLCDLVGVASARSGRRTDSRARAELCACVHLLFRLRVWPVWQHSADPRDSSDTLRLHRD